jgi:hypothetical protein
LSTNETEARRRRGVLERRARVSALRLSGLRHQAEIAGQLGVDKATICRDFAALDAEYRERAASDIEREKGRDLERIEVMIHALWIHAELGHLKAIDRVIRLLERKAKLLGLDGPTRVGVAHMIGKMADEHGLSDEERREAVGAAERYLKGMQG